MAIYPNTLFHLTTKEGLFGILENNFRPSWAREKIRSSTKIVKFAVPMVSFFDMRLSDLHIPMELKYGNYGIGMKKSWAESNNLSPVMYTNKDGIISERVQIALDILMKDPAKDIPNSIYSQLFLSSIDICRFIKNYKDDLIRDGKLVKKNYIFANEREWRYVLPLERIKEEYPVIFVYGNDNQFTKEVKNIYNSKVEDTLNFTPDDINFLIVEKREDIFPLIDHIRKCKAKYPFEWVEELQTKILLKEQILDDM